MSFKLEGFDEFVGALERTGDKSQFKRQSSLWLEAMGFQLLEEIQREIIRVGSVDTRRLLNSFTKGGDSNVWTLQQGGLQLDVGTMLKYAEWVNDGHFTIDPSKGLDRRWVPGNWKGDRFEYDPNEKENGMLLTFKWVEGSHYFDNAIKIFGAMFEASLARKVEEWANRGFR